MTLSLGRAARDHGRDARRRDVARASRAETVALLSDRPRRTRTRCSRACVARAREGARTVRDVICAEMWEAINTFHLGLADAATGVTRLRAARTRSSATSRSARRCSGASTARTMLRDEACAFLDAGGRIESADMVLRMLRVALPPPRRRPTPSRARRPGARAAAGRRRLPGLPPRGARAADGAAGRALPALRRAATRTRSPPSVDALHAALQPPTPTRAAPSPVLRLCRLLADLEFRARVGSRDARDLLERLRGLGAELGARRQRHRRAVLWRRRAAGASAGASPHALRDPLPHRVPLRRAGDRQPQRAARAAGDDGDPALRRVPRAHRPRGARSAATPTTSAPR